MSWISVKDRLPEKQERLFWVHTREEGVFEAMYTDQCRYKDGVFLPNFWGFAVEILDCYDHSVENITHWMPYSTPEPPHEKD